MYSVRKRNGHWIVTVNSSIYLSFESYADAVGTARMAAAVLRKYATRTEGPVATVPAFSFAGNAILAGDAYRCDEANASRGPDLNFH